MHHKIGYNNSFKHNTGKMKTLFLTDMSTKLQFREILPDQEKEYMILIGPKKAAQISLRMW